MNEPVDKFVPYIHWTFPDTKFEDNPDPSYMMARKLNRKTRYQAKVKPIEDSFAIKVQTDYDSDSIPTSIIKAPPVSPPISSKKIPKKSKKRKRHPDQPLTPKRPKTAFMMFLHNEKDRLKAKNVKIQMPELTRVVSRHWKTLSDETRAPFLEKNKALREMYEQQLKMHKDKMQEFASKYPDWDLDQSEDSDKREETKLGYKNLFNKVVKLNKEGQREAGNEFQYYFVLTYIPDLFWCHLAPLQSVGVFGPNRKKVEGRTKWKLVDEGEGKELDITGAVCKVVKSRVIKGCADADKEEWDIIDPDMDTHATKTISESQPLPQAPLSPKASCETKNIEDLSSINNHKFGITPIEAPNSLCAFSEQISESECSADAGSDTPSGSKEHPKSIIDRQLKDKMITPIAELEKATTTRQKLEDFQTSLNSYFKK